MTPESNEIIPELGTFSKNNRISDKRSVVIPVNLAHIADAAAETFSGKNSTGLNAPHVVRSVKNLLSASIRPRLESGEFSGFPSGRMFREYFLWSERACEDLIHRTRARLASLAGRFKPGEAIPEKAVRDAVLLVSTNPAVREKAMALEVPMDPYGKLISGLL